MASPSCDGLGLLLRCATGPMTSARPTMPVYNYTRIYHHRSRRAPRRETTDYIRRGFDSCVAEMITPK